MCCLKVIRVRGLFCYDRLGCLKKVILVITDSKQPCGRRKLTNLDLLGWLIRQFDNDQEAEELEEEEGDENDDENQSESGQPLLKALCVSSVY